MEKVVEQLVEALALLEGPCRGAPPAAGGHGEKCSGGCLGTGQAPAFPMLREPCPDDECRRNKGMVAWTGKPYFPDGDTQFVGHPECQGRGYLPVTTTDALLEAACSLQTVVIIAWHPTKKIWSVVIGSHKGDTADFKAAMALALCAAKGIEVK